MCLRFLAATGVRTTSYSPTRPYDFAARLGAPLSERLPAVLSEGARIVTESDKRKPLELALPLLTERVYGDTRIAIHG